MSTRNDAPVQFTAPGELRITRILPGPIERVWAYFSDPEKLGRWFAHGKIEMRVGGKVELNFKHADLTPYNEPIPEEYKGCDCNRQERVLACDPPHLLTISFGGCSGDESEVTFELQPQGSDVLLTLTHRKLGTRDMTLGVASGWTAHLAILVAATSGTPPPRFWEVLLAADAANARRFPQESPAP